MPLAAFVVTEGLPAPVAEPGGPPASDVELRRALVDNVSRHLRLHPEAQVDDGGTRLRPLTRTEAERIAKVALRAAAPWLRPVDVESHT